MSKTLTIFLLFLAVFVTGCSINHPVAKDYDQHLVKYGQETELPKTAVESDYLINRDTQDHSYQFRAATVGYAHVWIVEFGEILDKTLNSDYVQSAFGRLDKSSDGQLVKGSLIEFNLESYEFKNYRAYVSLNIDVSNDGASSFNKTYRSQGNSQGGQMWGAGPFGMKNATLKSTKQSIDKILAEFINDINQNNTASR